MAVSTTEALIALLYTTGENGIDEQHLLQILEIDQNTLEETIQSVQLPGLEIHKFGQVYVLTTERKMEPYIESLIENKDNSKLSQAAMETLAIIAYNQPITRNDIEMIRGINSDGPVKTLIAKGLIQSIATKESRAQQLYTTDLFLNVFGLSSLEALPTTDEDEEEIESFFNELIEKE